MRLAEPERGIVGEGARVAAAAAPLLAMGAVPGAEDAAVGAELLASIHNNADVASDAPPACGGGGGDDDV